MLKHFAAGLILAFATYASPVRAADAWSCDYEGYPNKGDVRNSVYVIAGYQLMESTVHVIDEYLVIENSNSTIVAGKAPRFGADERVAGLQVIIDKRTGAYLRTMEAIGQPTRKQTGQCKLLHSNL